MIAKKNKKVKGIINDWKRRLSMVGFMFLIIVLLNANIRIFIEKNKSEKELKKIEDAIEIEAKEKERYNFELGKSSGEEYLEKIAREELGLQKPGEQIIVIKKQEEIEQEEEQNKGAMEKIVDWFKGFLPE
ncbi:MAG: septum formation initiator family protein [Candidatus Pacebacteria bacterium]|nr:septum formation initiator family protein [Candidatus Paceibacterota bacterium]MDD5013144.1 septum formation initiator family protein [Candidatus Paceibacterota bacterium]MDD5752948.1 septum formation initiator family protein [Candidatus Paceibacterota bacterium]